MSQLNSASTRPLRSGRSMPVLGLGTWQLTHQTAESVADALELGYRMIDTSGDYGTQPGVGEAVAGSGISRTELYLVTKIEEDEDAYDSARRNLDGLDQEYVDLLLVHRPPEDGPGLGLWEGLLRAREDGLTRDVGVSNYSTGQMEALEEATGELPVVNQIEWSAFGWDEDMLEWCRERDVVIQAYSPLTRGKRLDDERLRELADRHDVAAAQVLLRWDLQMGVVPLPKSGRRDHQEENLRAFDFELSDGHMEKLGELNEQYSALGGLSYL